MTLAPAQSLAAGGSLMAHWVPRGKGLGLRLFFELERDRTVDVGAHQATWRRYLGSVEADGRWVLGRAHAVDVHGGFGFGWLAATGVGFSTNHPASGFFPGTVAGLRWSLWAAPPLALWLDLTGLYVLRGQSLVSHSASAQDVPSFQGFAGLGLAVGKARAGR